MLDQLTPFLPKGSLPFLADLLKNESYHLVITKPRSTKLGDFKPPRPGETPRLTVNGNLNEFAFLVTLVHEIAHLKVWNKHKNRVKPHGAEWKRCYGELLSSFLNKNLFPPKLEIALRAHVNQPKYTTGADHKLSLALREFDEPNDKITLHELKMGSSFKLGKRRFKVEEKLRSRFLCIDLDNGKKYRVHGMAEIEPLTLPKLG